MGIRSTFRPTFGPLQMNTNKSLRPTSLTVRIGPLRYRLWGRKRPTGVSSLNLPGPFSYRPAEHGAREHPAPYSLNPRHAGQRDDRA